jgi:signal transduction histidine kinase
VIPSAEVTRLFRLFERLATSRAGNGHGHGLGLSIVAAIADAHHATIDAHPQPGGGLLVRVSFPGQPPDTIQAEFDHMPSDGEGLRMSTTGQPH